MIFNKKIDYLFSKPIQIFKIDNFLEEELFNDLNQYFPKINKELSINNNFGKFTLDPKNIDFENSNQEKVIERFEKIIFSNNFFNFFTRTFYFKNFLAQKNILRKIKYLRVPKIFSDNQKINKLFFSEINVKYGFSYIKNEGGIVPHVDSQRKYLSLMLYFPNNENCENYGTTFFDSKIPNYSNTHLEENEIKNFKVNNKILFRTPFISNCLFGFVRNDFSWHSVEPINIYNKFVRRSININFLLKN
mgnify:CR=1 FL=1